MEQCAGKAGCDAPIDSEGGVSKVTVSTNDWPSSKAYPREMLLDSVSNVRSVTRKAPTEPGSNRLGSLISPTA